MSESKFGADLTYYTKIATHYKKYDNFTTVSNNEQDKFDENT